MHLAIQAIRNRTAEWDRMPFFTHNDWNQNHWRAGKATKKLGLCLSANQ
jgi:hypothetical protein